MNEDKECIKPRNKPNEMVEGITLHLLAKSMLPEDERIFYDPDAIRIR